MVDVLFFSCVRSPHLSELILLESSSPIDRAVQSHRLQLWWQFLQAVWQGPWWGYGWNQVSVAQAFISPMYSVQIFTEHTHNVFIDFLIWSGPLFGLLGVAFFSYEVFRIFIKLRGFLGCVCFSAVLVFMTHAGLEFPLEYAFFLLPFGFFLGGAARQCAVSFPSVKISGGASQLVAVVFSVILVLVWREYRLLEEDFRLMRFEMARIGQKVSSQPAPDVVLLTQLREVIRFGRYEARAGMSEEELEWMRQVAYRYPFAPSLLRYALALGVNGRPDSAVAQIKLIYDLHGEKDYKSALQVLEVGAENNSSLTEVMLLLQ